LRTRADVIERVAAQEDGHVVLLELRRAGVAREANRWQERRLAGSAVVRAVLRPRLGHVALEVRQAPGDGDAEPRRGRRETAVEPGQLVLKIPLRRAQV